MTDVDRRNFLKKCALGAALGVAGGTGGAGIIKAAVSDEGRSGGTAAGGKRWAMVIDLKKCRSREGCTDCREACNVTHNVPDFDNPKDEVKWIWKESFEHVFHDETHARLNDHLKHSPVPVLCNHCDNPYCVQVCPTQATWKRKSDGLVMMDWHRCIGCRYCMVACPYGSRSFNWRDPRPHIKKIDPRFPTRKLGVVEKCTFCESRLAKGLKPACVEACKEKAMVFGDLEDTESEVREVLAKNFTIRRRPGLGTQPQVYYIV